MKKVPSFAKAYTHNQNGISITARPCYLQDESNLVRNRHVFGYQMNIENHKNQPVCITGRHWTVIDAHDERYEVTGKGVVGKKPLIEPGDGFTYSSFCVLYTFTGIMRGFYRIEYGDEELNIRTPTFYLHSYLLN